MAHGPAGHLLVPKFVFQETEEPPTAYPLKVWTGAAWVEKPVKFGAGWPTVIINPL